jgi:hypothetical protein
MWRVALAPSWVTKYGSNQLVDDNLTRAVRHLKISEADLVSLWIVL